jgi:DNA-binding beta-propeller fold protein YncE
MNQPLGMTVNPNNHSGYAVNSGNDTVSVVTNFD